MEDLTTRNQDDRTNAVEQLRSEEQRWECEAKKLRDRYLELPPHERKAYWQERANDFRFCLKMRDHFREQRRNFETPQVGEGVPGSPPETGSKTKPVAKPSETPLKGLPAKKCDLSSYFDGAKLTDKQRECASLAWEYGLSVSEIAQRLKRHRTTIDQNLALAKKKIDEAQANEKHARNAAKSGAP